MNFYKTECNESPNPPQKLPTIKRPRVSAHESTVNDEIGQNYIPSKQLASAVNTALMLRAPLLVTGEPGTGKTELASSVAYQLGYRLLPFVCKSTSQATELFYTFDTLGRFHASKFAKDKDPREFVRYDALGKAILFANEGAKLPQFLPSWFDPKHLGPPSHSVVLIDEIDKAPRDFPNDLLNELESMRFQVRELVDTPPLEAPDEFKPVVIITSNSERGLPDAFLRRCIYHHIGFPTRKELTAILLARLEVREPEEVINSALDLFDKLREPTTGLQKKPTTAELISWLQVLRKRAPDEPNPVKNTERVIETLCVLVKKEQDRLRAVKQVESQTP